MNRPTTAADLSNYETAIIRDGDEFDVVMRRRGPAIMGKLPIRSRRAVTTYITVAESIMAGGCRYATR